MENITSFLRTVAYILMFCIAGYHLLYEFRNFNILITTVKKDISNQTVLYEQYIEEIEENTVSYGEVVAGLMGELDYDIKINNVLLSKDDYNYEEFDFSGITESEYEKSYEYDTSGNITTVIYQSIDVT